MRPHRFDNLRENLIIPLVTVVALIPFVVLQLIILIFIVPNRVDALFSSYGSVRFFYEHFYLFDGFWLSVTGVSHLALKRIRPKNQIVLLNLLILVKWAALTIFCIDIFIKLLIYFKHPDYIDLPLFSYVLGPVLYLIFWRLPKRHLAQWSEKLELKDLLALENSVRTTLIQIIGGVVLLLGLFQNWMVSQRNINLAVEKTQTEQLKQAITDLKDSNCDVQINAINTLLKLAAMSWDSYKPVRENLAIYVREHAAWKDDQASLNSGCVIPPRFIQTILTFLVRQPSLRDSGGEQIPPIDLHGTDLRGADLTNAFLFDAILNSAHLEYANLSRASLDGASLQGASLENADLREANLRGVNFGSVTLTGAKFDRAVLYFADLSTSDLTIAQVQVARYDYTTTLPKKVQEQLDALTQSRSRSTAR